MHDLSIHLFGSPQIKRGNQQVTIQRRKDLALLIYLVVTSQPHSRDILATLLWQEYSQTDARSSLRKSLSRLRAELGEDFLAVSQNEVSINPRTSFHSDVEQFNANIRQAREHAHAGSVYGLSLCPECQRALEEAAGLYQADFLAGFSVSDSPVFEEWQFFQSESLRKNLAETLDHLARHHLSSENYTIAIEYARRWLALDKLHEPAHRQLMLLYALSGQQAAAIRQYEECARLLDEELGAEPEAETLRVYEAVRKKKVQEFLEIPQKAKAPPKEEQSKLSPGIAHNLPVHLTPFVAREHELQEISRLLQLPACRLLTLVGPGGSGKTRLAAQIASSLAQEMGGAFKDGAWFIPLAPLTDPQSIAGSILQVLQISGVLKGADARQKLLDHLRGRRILLVLDNFEHLLGAESTELVSAIASTAPHSRILVTSRQRLDITGEYLFPVEGLELPAEAALVAQTGLTTHLPMTGALRLFEQCAQRIQPSFRITAQNYRPVTQICRIVQGMPLAIELAASWLQVFSPEDINSEIERSLDFLESNWRDLPDRQRSLRAVFDSSWALLDKKSRPILKALSIFRSSFTREAAQAVAGASAKALLDLANKSWIQKTSSGRYQIHELLRQYTFEIFQKEKASFDQVEKQYCEYYADFSFSLWQMLKGPSQGRAFLETENEFENMRVAWLLLISHSNLETAVDRMLPILFHYCEVHGKVPELMKLVEVGVKTVEAPGAECGPKTEIMLRTVQGAFYVDGFSVRLSVNQAIFPNNLGTIQRAWSLSHSEIEFEELDFWGIILAFLYARIVNFEDGRAHLEDLLVHFQRRGKAWELANGYLHGARLLLCNRGEVLNQQDTLIQYLSRAMELFSSLGDRINVAHTLTQWAELKFYQQNLKEAIQQWEAARSTLLTIGEWKMANETLWNISELYLQLGFFEKSFDGFREIANTFLEHGLIQNAVGALSKESFEKVRYGDLSDALSIRQRCLAMVQEAGLEYQFAWNYWEMGEVIRVSGNLEEASTWFERSHPIFENFGDPLGNAFYYRGMGDVALARKDYQLAQDNFAKSAELARATKHTWMLIYALTGLGRSQLALKNLDLAMQYFEEALDLSSRVKDKGIALMVLGGVTELLTRLGRPQEAIEVGSVVENHFASWRETKNQVSASLASLKKSTTAREYKQAQKRGSSRDLWDTVDRWAAELEKPTSSTRAVPKQKAREK